MSRTFRTTLVIGTACAALAGSAHAGGLYLHTFGTPSMGTATAGANAMAVDAATVFENPAGMTRVKDHQGLMGLAPGFSVIKFDPDADTPFSGGDGGNQGGFLPISSSNYVHKISDRFRFGFNLLSISGATLDPNDGWTGRAELTKVNLFTLTLFPAFAARVTDWLSVGAGPAVTYGMLDYELRVPIAQQQKIKLEDLDDWEVAPVASVLLEPIEDLRIGVLYQGETDFHFKGRTKLPRGIPSPNINLDLPLAQAVRASIYWDATDELALMMSGGWEDWSEAKDLPVSTGGASAAVPLGFRDTWYLAGGIHYRVSEKWTLQTGFRYDSSALKDSDRTVAFPIDRQLTYGAGGIYDWSETLSVGIHFTYIDLGKSPVNTRFVKGDYQYNDLFLFGVTLNWKKLPWSGSATI